MKLQFLPIILIVILIQCTLPFQNEQSPADAIWIQVASAERQCITPDYSSLEEAINELKENKIAVFSSNELNFPVCLACTCPTGIIYQAQIKKDHLAKAIELGWQTVNVGDDSRD